jgi:hypothetical protein
VELIPEKHEYELAYLEATNAFEITSMYFQEQDELYLKSLHLLGSVLYDNKAFMTNRYP